MIILAIDPGPVQSAFVIYKPHKRCIMVHDKIDNAAMLRLIYRYEFPSHCYLSNRCVIERIASYGKPVGEEVFDTVLWAGRFAQAWDGTHNPIATLMYRRTVKIHLCSSNNAKDAHIRQRLIDLFGPGKEAAIGKKKTPGPLYKIKADEWQALALAVTFADACKPNTDDELRRYENGE